MRMTLAAAPSGAIQPPVGFSWRDFDPDTDPEMARAMLNAAYASGGGAVCDWREWWCGVRDDEEFDRELCFLAVDTRSGEMAAFAQCWSSGFIKDIAVAQLYRGQGLGGALLRQIFMAFKSRGADHVDLKVTSNNPSGAIAVYQKLGMQIIETP